MVLKEARVCDLDEGPIEAVEEVTIRIGVEDAVVLDVCEKHLAQVQALIPSKPSIPSEPPKKRAAKKAAAKKAATPRAGGYTTLQVKKWAEANGVEVPARGRLPRAIIDQYLAATGD